MNLKTILNKEQLKQAKHILILPHTMPDGDTIGSCVAFYYALKQMDIAASIVLDDVIPDEISHIGNDIIINTATFLSKKIEYDVCFCVDMSDLERLKMRKTLIEGKKLYNIDHHKSNTNFGDINIVDTQAAATGEIIFLIIQSLDLELTPKIAEALYIAIVTDTGNFKYSSTTSNTLRIAAELFAIDFNREETINKLYHSIPRSKMALHSDCLSHTRYFNDGKITLCTVSLEQLETFNASPTHTDGLVESARDIEGVQMVILLKEVAEDEIKVSLRSLGDIDVSTIALEHQGGGHKNAAGFSFNMCLDDAVNYVINSIIPKVSIK